LKINILESLDEIITQADFKVQGGRLVVVENPKRIDVQIDAKPRALSWSFLGNKKLCDGSTYKLRTAWLRGDVRVFGAGSTVEAVYFFENVWEELRRSKSFSRLAPLFARLVS